MRIRNGMRWTAIQLALAVLVGALPAREASTRPSIVRVHEVWVDGSGWRGVFDRLTREGFEVTVVQQPLTSFAEDLAATRRVLDQQRVPVLLVAHSYGGSVITEAGTHPAVVGLVSLAAHMPDAGESEAADGRRFPSDLARSTAIRTTKDGFTSLDPSRFHECFAADVSGAEAAFMARSQLPIASANFGTPITTPVWRSKPSWMLIPTKDRVIYPELERWYATRAKSRVEVAGASHAVHLSRPDEVTALIRTAASGVRQLLHGGGSVASTHDRSPTTPLSPATSEEQWPSNARSRSVVTDRSPSVVTKAARSLGRATGRSSARIRISSPHRAPTPERSPISSSPSPRRATDSSPAGGRAR